MSICQPQQGFIRPPCALVAAGNAAGKRFENRCMLAAVRNLCVECYFVSVGVPLIKMQVVADILDVHGAFRPTTTLGEIECAGRVCISHSLIIPFVAFGPCALKAQDLHSSSSGQLIFQSHPFPERF